MMYDVTPVPGEPEAWGQPWHGKIEDYDFWLENGTLKGHGYFVGYLPGCILVQLPGFPDPGVLPEEAAAGAALRNYAILNGSEHQYDPQGQVTLGRRVWVYRGATDAPVWRLRVDTNKVTNPDVIRVYAASPGYLEGAEQLVLSYPVPFPITLASPDLLVNQSRSGGKAAVNIVDTIHFGDEGKIMSMDAIRLYALLEVAVSGGTTLSAPPGASISVVRDPDQVYTVVDIDGTPFVDMVFDGGGTDPYPIPSDYTGGVTRSGSWSFPPDVVRVGADEQRDVVGAFDTADQMVVMGYRYITWKQMTATPGGVSLSYSYTMTDGVVDLPPPETATATASGVVEAHESAYLTRNGASVVEHYSVTTAVDVTYTFSFHGATDYFHSVIPPASPIPVPPAWSGIPVIAGVNIVGFGSAGYFDTGEFATRWLSRAISPDFIAPISPSSRNQQDIFLTAGYPIAPHAACHPLTGAWAFDTGAGFF